MLLGTISYAVAAAVFLLLAALLFFSWKGRPQGRRFIVASLVTSAWALLMALQSYWAHIYFLPLYFAELLRSGSWLAVLLGVAGAAISRTLRIATYTLWGVFAAGTIVLSILEYSGVQTLQPTLLLSRSGLILALCGLVLVEQIYRNSAAEARGNLRYLVLGVGGLFAYDLFLYSQAELLRAIGSDAWDVRALVNALLVPVIAVAVKRNPQWSLDVFVSRQVVFYTGTFIAVGIYLLMMSIGGYYVRVIGGTWGGIAQILFMAGATGVLASLIFSMSLRARLKVFLHKHFYRNKYDYRIEWLRFMETLSSTDEADVGRRALRAVAQIFSSPGGILFAIDDARRNFTPLAVWPAQLQIDPPPQALRSDHEVAQLLGRQQWIIDLEQQRAGSGIHGQLRIPDWMRANRALRMVAPLMEQDSLLGFVVLCDPAVPFKLHYEDRDLLKTVGRHVAIQIAQHQADRRLADSRQFEAYNRLTAFMMHDLKNSVAQLKLLVANAERHKRNPAFVDDAISTIANAVERMSRLIAQLREEGAGGGVRSVDLQEVVRGAVARCGGRRPVPSFAVGAQQMETPITVLANTDKLTSVIENLLRNAQDATPESGSVALRLLRNDASATLEIADSGCGMDAEFVRDRLFRPFDSTKGSKGMGIGAYQAREYLASLGGGVEVQSSPGQGTVFSITLPLSATSPEESAPA